MKGYRDTMGTGPHAVRLDGVELNFGAEGVLWEPTPQEEAVLTKDATRAGRFAAVEAMGKSPAADEPVAGEALFDPVADEATEVPAARSPKVRKG